MGKLYEDVYKVIEKIPPGKVVSYGQIAWMIGRPRAARVVGQALAHCPEHLPWHRVVRSDGSIAVRSFPEVWVMLLTSEGVTFLPDGRVDMRKHNWNGEGL